MENIFEVMKNKGKVVEKPQHQWLTVDGVYIQDINGKLWEIMDWDDSVKPNAIAVITPEHKFRISLTQIRWALNHGWRGFEFIKDRDTAKADFNGVANTRKIINSQPTSIYIAGLKNFHPFHDGSKGYLPALGELFLAYQNRVAIAAALATCGGEMFSRDEYWSSTFCDSENDHSFRWMLNWGNGRHYIEDAESERIMRPFAVLEI